MVNLVVTSNQLECNNSMTVATNFVVTAVTMNFCHNRCYDELGLNSNQAGVSESSLRRGRGGWPTGENQLY